MMRKTWFALAICAAAAVVFLAFYGWRHGGLDLLPLKMAIC